MIVPTVVAKFSERKQRRKAVRDAYNLNPGNVPGGAKFASDDDLRSGAVQISAGIPIGYSPDGPPRDFLSRLGAFADHCCLARG